MPDVSKNSTPRRSRTSLPSDGSHAARSWPTVAMSTSPRGATTSPRTAAPRAPRTGRRPPTRISRIGRRLLVVGATVVAVSVLAVSASGWTLLTWSSRSIARVDAFAGLTDRPPPSAAAS